MREVESTKEAEEVPELQARRRTLRVVFSADQHAVGRTFELDGSSYLFGRAVEGVGLIHDGRISREHARVSASSDRHEYVVEDLGAKNGLFLHGKRIEKPAPLLSGQVLSLGDTLLVVDQDPDPESLPVAADVSGDAVLECVGSSYAVDRLRRSIATVASTKSAVLILGETGTGKEVTASAIHRLSGLHHFVGVNCAGIPPDRAEAELYGWKKGAFTGASADHDGYFVQASDGTIFLDEIADLSAAVQASLLRVLQDGSIQPIGGEPRRVKVRAIAATHKDLGPPQFRQDLLARISDWVLNIPPLRDRRVDILELWDHFQGAERRPLSPIFAESLLLYSWPMNIRELEKMAQTQAVLAVGSSRFEPKHLPAKLQGLVKDRAEKWTGTAKTEPDRPLREPTLPPDDGRPAREEIVAALERHSGNVQKTAKEMNWHRTQLMRWIGYHAIDLEALRTKK